MRILTLSNCPLAESQGSGYAILNFTRGLQALGHHVDILGPETLELLPRLRRAKSHRLSLGIALAALGKIARNRYDVVEFYGGEAWLAIALLSKIPRRPFILVQHSNGIEPHVDETLRRVFGSDTLDGKPRRWFQRLLRPAMEKAFTIPDGLVVPSEFERDYALARGFQPPGRVRSIEYGLPEDFLGLDIPLERPNVIGFCGSWLLRKGNDTLKEDLPEILRRFPLWRFKLVGVGPEFRKENHFPPDVCPRIEVIPFVNDKPRLRLEYQSIKIFIFPSVYESFGLVIAEAMACGCAVVTGQTGFAGGLVDREEFYLIHRDRAPDLRTALEDLMVHDEHRSCLARGGYQRVQKLRWRVSSESLENAYLTWLSAFYPRRRSPASPQGSALQP